MSKWDFAVAAWVPISTENILCARATRVKPSRLKGAKLITRYVLPTKRWMMLKNERRRAIQCCCEENVICSFCWNWGVTKRRSRKERLPEPLNAAAKHLQVGSFNKSKRRVIPRERIIENLKPLYLSAQRSFWTSSNVRFCAGRQMHHHDSQVLLIDSS